MSVHSANKDVTNSFMIIVKIDLPFNYLSKSTPLCLVYRLEQFIYIQHIQSEEIDFYFLINHLTCVWPA